MRLSIFVEVFPADRSGSDVVARVELPSGESLRATGRSVPEALGLLFVNHRDAISDAGSTLRRLIESAMFLGVPGVVAFGDGLVHRLTWTKELLSERFDWPDFSDPKVIGYKLTSEKHYVRKTLSEVLREQGSVR